MSLCVTIITEGLFLFFVDLGAGESCWTIPLQPRLLLELARFCIQPVFLAHYIGCC